MPTSIPQTSVAERVRHPNLTYSLFSGLATGARLFCAFIDLQQECLANGLDLKDEGLASLDGWASHVWVGEAKRPFVPYLLSEPEQEPAVVVHNDGSIMLRWDAVDSEPGSQPLDSDVFRLDDLRRPA